MLLMMGKMSFETTRVSLVPLPAEFQLNLTPEDFSNPLCQDVGTNTYIKPRICCVPSSVSGKPPFTHLWCHLALNNEILIQAGFVTCKTIWSGTHR